MVKPSANAGNGKGAGANYDHWQSLSAAAATGAQIPELLQIEAFSSMATVVKTKSDAGQTMDLKAQARP